MVKKEKVVVEEETKKPTIKINKKRRVIKVEEEDEESRRNAQMYNAGGYAGEGDRGELLLSTERAPVDRISQVLSERGILGNRVLMERIQLSRCKKDPIYTILFFSDHPDTDVVGRDGSKIHLIDYMLNECFNLLKETLGELFTKFDLITKTYENLMKTDDTHAKIWLFLFILQREKPIQDMLFELYTDDEYTSHRLVHFLQKLLPLVEETVTLPYTDASNDFNVKNLVRMLLARCISDYMLYTKDPRYSN